MTKEELKLTSKEALKRVKNVLNWNDDLDIDKDLYDLWVNLVCKTIEKDLDRLEKLEKENQDLKGKVNYLEKVIEGIKNLPHLDCTHMFDNCKLTPLPEVEELKKVGQMTYLQKVLIENMNEFCSEKFDLSYERTQEEAEEYINKNIEEYRSLTTHNWY